MPIADITPWMAKFKRANDEARKEMVIHDATDLLRCFNNAINVTNTALSFVSYLNDSQLEDFIILYCFIDKAMREVGVVKSEPAVVDYHAEHESDYSTLRALKALIKHYMFSHHESAWDQRDIRYEKFMSAASPEALHATSFHRHYATPFHLLNNTDAENYEKAIRIARRIILKPTAPNNNALVDSALTLDLFDHDWLQPVETIIAHVAENLSELVELANTKSKSARSVLISLAALLSVIAKYDSKFTESIFSGINLRKPQMSGILTEYKDNKQIMTMVSRLNKADNPEDRYALKVALIEAHLSPEQRVLLDSYRKKLSENEKVESASAGAGDEVLRADLDDFIKPPSEKLIALINNILFKKSKREIKAVRRAKSIVKKYHEQFDNYTVLLANSSLDAAANTHVKLLAAVLKFIESNSSYNDSLMALPEETRVFFAGICTEITSRRTPTAAASMTTNSLLYGQAAGGSTLSRAETPSTIHEGEDVGPHW